MTHQQDPALRDARGLHLRRAAADIDAFLDWLVTQLEEPAALVDLTRLEEEASRIVARIAAPRAQEEDHDRG